MMFIQAPASLSGRSRRLEIKKTSPVLITKLPFLPDKPARGPNKNKLNYSQEFH